MRSWFVFLAFAQGACAARGVGSPSPAAYVVVLPRPEDDPAPAGAAQPVHIVPSSDIPAWQPPRGHGDPCATFTSDKGIYDCDATKEDAPTVPAEKKSK